jgi:hypothetical protein
VTIGFDVIIEVLVAVLLLLTIGYCIMLNKRLMRLKADEHTLKATISELITATEIAERAVAGLKVTVHECDAGLGQRLQSADVLNAELARQIGNGEQLLGKIAQIVGAARSLPQANPVPPIAPDAHSTVAAAQAFATRARLRAQGAAA